MTFELYMFRATEIVAIVTFAVAAVAALIMAPAGAKVRSVLVMAVIAGVVIGAASLLSSSRAIVAWCFFGPPLIVLPPARTLWMHGRKKAAVVLAVSIGFVAFLGAASAVGSVA
ncbi:MAG: hypothetical protein IT381_26205 [Deltaproteobacteria bacterium]|nr:hypothetical protein [Deltaproteobacteria bacterium]